MCTYAYMCMRTMYMRRYNEEQFYPAHGTHATVGVTSRVMNYLCNLNSKTFFRFVRCA